MLPGRHHISARGSVRAETMRRRRRWKHPSIASLTCLARCVRAVQAGLCSACSLKSLASSIYSGQHALGQTRGVRLCAVTAFSLLSAHVCACPRVVPQQLLPDRSEHLSQSARHRPLSQPALRAADIGSNDGSDAAYTHGIRVNGQQQKGTTGASHDQTMQLVPSLSRFSQPPSLAVASPHASCILAYCSSSCSQYLKSNAHRTLFCKHFSRTRLLDRIRIGDRDRS